MLLSGKRILFVTMLSVLGLAACGDESEGGSTSGENVPGTAAKGEPCTDSTQCAESSAQCLPSGVCTGSLDGDAFVTECASGQSDMCAGFFCMILKPNVQNKTGLCSAACTESSDCGPSGVCSISVGTKKFCLKPCTSSDDCINGFVCVDNPDGVGKACFVEPS